jgi:hypothetical protein
MRAVRVFSGGEGAGNMLTNLFLGRLRIFFTDLPGVASPCIETQTAPDLNTILIL